MCRINLSFKLIVISLFCFALNSKADTAHPDSVGTVPDGKYYYIPDSLANDVETLLRGHSRVVDDDLNLDLDEKVLVNGDTVPIALRDRNLGRFDRGLTNLLYVPKGQWTFGLTASYGEISTDNLELFGLLTDVDITAHAFSIKPYFAYFIKNNLSVGLRFKYYNARGDLDSFNVDMADSFNFNLHDIGYKAESYSASAFLSSYVGLSRNGRFGVYNEVELAFASGSSDFTRPFGSEIRNTHTGWTEAQLNFSPGLQVFIMKNVAFHVSFGVFGFYLRNEKQTENGEKIGSRFSSGGNFRFNIFNINFGIGIFI